MRRSLARSFCPAVFAGFLALAAGRAAVAEDIVEDVQSEGTQIVAADVGDAKPAKRNLNTVPEDGFAPENAEGPNGRLVRQLRAARPNEDLIICVAGCFSGRDRVVYAQPVDKPTVKRTSAGKSDKQHIGASDADTSSGTAKAATIDATPPRAGVAPSPEPRAPVVLNGASDGTSGGSSVKGANAVTPALKGTMDSADAPATPGGATN
jgi:hypothetical protein